MVSFRKCAQDDLHHHPFPRFEKVLLKNIFVMKGVQMPFIYHNVVRVSVSVRVCVCVCVCV